MSKSPREVKEIFEDLFEAIEKAPQKTVEQKMEEAEQLQGIIKSEPDPYDGWTKAIDGDVPNTGALPKATLWVLRRFERYGPMSPRGIRNDIYARVGEKSGALQVAALEARRLVKVKEVGGRSMWEITPKGKEVLEHDGI